MVDAAQGMDARPKELLLYFAKLVEPLEAGRQSVDTQAFWTGVIIGFVVGIIFAASIL